MPYLWAKDDPGFTLTYGSLFSVAYLQSFQSHITDLQQVQMTEAEVNQITENITVHSSLDLDSTFQTFRLSGCLSPTDTVAIQSFLEECQNDVKALNAKINDTISTISQLSRELTQASAHMVQQVSQTRLCEFLLSSHKHFPKYLPQDVLEEIFLACLATREDPIPHPNDAPLQIASVCHRWRTIALSMPVLWNTLYINFPKHIDLAQTWLSRCNRPSLVMSSTDNRIAPTQIQEFVDVLDRNSLFPRIIDVSLLANGMADAIKEFILDNDQFAPEELVITSRGNGGTLQSLPTQLQRLYSHIIPQTLLHSLPPSDLTVLWLTPRIHYTTFMSVLVNCPNLESLFVALGGKQPQTQIDQETLELEDVTPSRLHYLGIWDNSNSATSRPPDDLLKRFSFPLLRVAEYGRFKKSAAWFGLAHVLQSVQRLSLDLTKDHLTVEYLVALFRHANSLVELAISTDSRSIQTVLTAVTPVVLPTLQALYLDISWAKLTKWLSFETKLAEFGLAWSSKDVAPSLHPLELVIQFWHPQGEGVDDETNEDEDEDESDGDEEEDELGEIEDWERLKVRKVLQSACPDLHVRIVTRGAGDYWFWDLPILFEMAHQPSNSVLLHDVLDDDGNWRRKSGSVYRIQ